MSTSAVKKKFISNFLTSLGAQKKLKKLNQELLYSTYSTGLTLTNRTSLADMEELLSQGADPNAMDREQLRVFHFATDLEKIEALLKAGADPNLPSGHRALLPVELAIDNGAGPNAIRLFLHYGADLSRMSHFSPLMVHAILGDNEAIVHPSKSHTPEILNQGDVQRGRTALYFSLFSPDPLSTLNTLLLVGANPLSHPLNDNYCEKKQHPFIASLENPELLPCFERLLEHSGDQLTQEQVRIVLLQTLEYSDAADAILLLFKYVPQKTQTALDESASLLFEQCLRLNHAQNLQVLLHQGLLIPAEFKGFPPLEYALASGAHDCCRLLVLRGCEMTPQAVALGVKQNSISMIMGGGGSEIGFIEELLCIEQSVKEKHALSQDIPEVQRPETPNASPDTPSVTHSKLRI